MKKVLVIVGPTGSGKTELSIRLAQALDTQIINGDSVQVYKGLDIGSAKIKPQEKQNIIHHLIDIVSPGEDYSVYHFQRDVRALILKLDLPLIVGGTGLYIKAALAQYEFVESSRNQDFESLYQNESNESLYQMLIFRDPDIKIDIQNRRRLLRALEQALSGELRSKKTEKDILLYDALVLYLDLDKTILEQRLKSRL
ncbi:MAG: tRNA (adenosine(37)-N6)-dimethylallyltransferase MiaA, partial [Bacillota bacterium]